MASPGNRHCANCIGTLSFPTDSRDRVRYFERNDLVRSFEYESRLIARKQHHHHHFICPIIQQYAHLHEYNSRRAGQQGPI